MSDLRKLLEADLGPEKPYDPDYAAEVSKEPICNCPLCGRTHRKMPFGKPPASISDTVIIPRAQYEALMGLEPIVRKLAYVRAPLNDNVYREARDAIAALRSAGIEETR